MAARTYSEAEKEFISGYAYGHSYIEIVEEFNRRFEKKIVTSQIKSYLKNRKIITGKTGRFKKGHVPANKGKHTGGWKPTQFEKGHIPANHKPVGSESVRGQNNKQHEYVFVKVAEPNVWRMKHIVEWEKYNGKVPKGKILIFLDGNTSNTNIENLMLIDRNIHARMNQNRLRFEDAESTKTAVTVAQLIIATSKVKKK